MTKTGSAVEALEQRCLFAGVTFASLTIPAGPTPVKMASGDFNGDGKPDIVVANVRGSNGPPNGVTYGLSLLTGNGDGTLAAPVFIDPRDNQPSTSIRVADLNGDGKLDLVTADAVLIGDGTGHFAVSTRPAAASFDIGDVDGDGKIDIVEDAQPRVAGSPLMVRPGNGDGTFGTAFELPVDESVSASAATRDIRPLVEAPGGNTGTSNRPS